MAKYKCPVCNQPCESEAGCFRHKPRKPIKNFGRKLSVKRKSKEEIMQEQEDRDRMWELFLEIWKERGPYSEIDDTYLGREPLTTFFDHLLPKETFPEVKYEKWNILMVTWEQHDAKHNGFACARHLEEIERAKQIYNKLFS